VGTIVYNKETGEQIADLSVDGETVLIASGGRGGPGNMAFVSGSTRSPRIAIEGQPGTEITLQLDLKTIADAAFVGLPNAGKSSLLAQLTRAAPKVADYPFTTLQPYVGFMDRSDFRAPVTIADIPGLVEGAHANRGLGHRFLRHVQRAQLLVLVVDASQDMKDQVSMLLEEMDLFDTELVARAQIVVANKVDLIPDRSAFSKRLATIRRRYPDASCVAVSATTGEGIDDLKLLIEKRVSSPVE
jgi:GTP-binding protein